MNDLHVSATSSTSPVLTKRLRNRGSSLHLSLHVAGNEHNKIWCRTLCEGKVISFSQIYFQSFKFILADCSCMHTHISWVFTLTQEPCAVCAQGGRDKRCRALTSYLVSAFSFLAVTNSSLANPFILSRN